MSPGKRFSRHAAVPVTPEAPGNDAPTQHEAFKALIVPIALVMVPISIGIGIGLSDPAIRKAYMTRCGIIAAGLKHSSIRCMELITRLAAASIRIFAATLRSALILLYGAGMVLAASAHRGYEALSARTRENVNKKEKNDKQKEENDKKKEKEAPKHGHHSAHANASEGKQSQKGWVIVK
ncbi:unnamed protein product [Zymoseptoria tritici ST99CH_1A5]|uniref:Uncharacterized protein n=1 Tax=Zymoseptoria tritici ST99CH_1A5 TaxID=1276529 RepID=A0A1Y6M1H6_ZYMTR|nr:unnamed protein product [Zymoseptoria tritici ST99CH_1A5]